MCTFSVAIDALLSNADVCVCSFPDIACPPGKLDPYLVESGERQGDAAVCVIKSRRSKRTHCELAFMGKLALIHASITYSIIPHHITCGLSSNTHILLCILGLGEGLQIFIHPSRHKAGLRVKLSS